MGTLYTSNQKAEELRNYLNGIGVEAAKSCIRKYRTTGEKQLGVRVGEIPPDKIKEVLSKINEIAGEYLYYITKDRIICFEKPFSMGCGGDG